MRNVGTDRDYVFDTQEEFAQIVMFHTDLLFCDTRGTISDMMVSTLFNLRVDKFKPSEAKLSMSKPSMGITMFWCK